MVARANNHVTYPARFQLVAAMNPCRCGYLGDAEMECTKAPRCGGDYQAKLSGPLLDRIDLQVEVGAVAIADLAQEGGEKSVYVARRVAAARHIQEERYAALGQDNVLTNAQASAELIEEVAHMEDAARGMFHAAAERLKLSARAYHRLLKVARTIADLDNAAFSISAAHVAEALSYRRLRNS